MQHSEDPPGPKWAYTVGEYLYLIVLRPILWWGVLTIAFFVPIAFIMEAVSERRAGDLALTLVSIAALAGALFHGRLAKTRVARLLSSVYGGLKTFLRCMGELLGGIIGGFLTLLGWLLLMAVYLFIIGGVIGILLFGFRQLF